MVIYLDLAFMTNCLSDALAIYLTARLSGLVLRPVRLIVAALFGGFYGVLCVIPLFAFMRSFLVHIAAAAILIRYVFGKNRTILRVLFLFYFLSCMIGGTFLSIAQYAAGNGFSNALQQVNWKVFLLVGGSCLFLLSAVFSGKAKHVVSGELSRGCLTLCGKSIHVDALLDTGHTLSDPYSGAPVITVWYGVLEPLLSADERSILLRMSECGCTQCAEKLAGIAPGRYCLLPYRAVGVECAMLLAFRADMLTINGNTYSPVLVAVSPTTLSDGGGHTALWGGERTVVASNDSENGLCISQISSETRID